MEPAYGEQREEALAKAGITTYFIVKALKPFKPAVTKSLASLADAEQQNQRNQRPVRNTNGQNKEEDELYWERLAKELESLGICGLLFLLFCAMGMLRERLSGVHAE